MKALRVSFTFTTKDGFSENDLRQVIEKNLAEINCDLSSFNFEKDSVDLCKEFPVFNKKLCLCTCELSSSMPLDYRIVLGCFTPLSDEYPCINLNTINTPEVIG